MDRISQQLPHLPLEIIINILIRLPVKSLIRFKCVSKSMQALISNTQFINTHLNISSRTPNSARIILTSYHPRYVFKSYSLHSVLNFQPHNAQELDYPFKETNAFVCIVGSCNGLVCLVIKSDIFIWNPLTSVSKKLPGFEVTTYVAVYGFGFDERGDDYKVVGIFDSKIAGVYSLKADSWKTIADFPSEKKVVRYDGKFLNGSIHWAVRMNIYSKYPNIIVCLDLLHETYGEIEKPDYGINYYFELCVLQGCLCVLAVFDHDRSDLWIMKEYGVIDSWVKLCAIPFVNKSGYSLYSMPLSISGSGELLIMEKSVVLYNPSDETFREAKVPKDAVVYTHAAIYVESLVSPYLNGL